MEKVIVFGRGRYYLSKKEGLKERYDVIGFLDNAVKPDEVQEFEGKQVVHPEKYSCFTEESAILLMSAAFFEMWEQLRLIGIAPERVKFAVLMQPYYDEMETVLADTVDEISAADTGIAVKERSGVQIFSTQDAFKAYLRPLFFRKYESVKRFADLPDRPVSKRFGLERGTSIDRVYIERFLEMHRDKIKGTVMEIADAGYTQMFGAHVTESLVLHVNGWGRGVIKGNLETGEGIPENSVDCLICTQTLQFIYDIHSAVRNIHRLLRPGGVALVTAHCLGQISLYDYYNWGEYWRFTEQSMQRLFEEVFADDNIRVQSWGNVKTAAAFQYGLCAEDLREEDFVLQDEQYPVVVTAAVRK